MSEEPENRADRFKRASRNFAARVAEAERRLSIMTTDRLLRLLQIEVFDSYSRVAARRVLQSRKDLDPRTRMLWRCQDEAAKKFLRETLQKPL